MNRLVSHHYERYIGPRVTPEKPYVNEGALYLEDIQPGDVVQRVHAGGHHPTPCVDTQVITGIDQEKISVLYVGGIFHGKAKEEFATDHGLAPYNTDNGEQWNRYNFTRSLDVRTPLMPIGKEQAQRLRKLFESMSAMQDKYGVEPVEPSIGALALDAFIEQALKSDS